MSKEVKTFEGMVAKINPWTKGNGYFLNLDSTEEKIFGFGKPSCDEGDNVRLTVEPGSKSFSDKWSIKKTEKLNNESKIQASEVNVRLKNVDIADKAQSISKIDTQESISRSVALKRATDLVIAYNSLKENDDSLKSLTSDIKLTAKEFLKFLTGRD